MKIFFTLIIISISFLGLSNIKYYQDNRLVGIEKHNKSNQIIYRYGYLIDVYNPNKESNEYEQYFYDSLGRLKIKVKGDYLLEAEILSYSYEENELVKITDHIKNNNWFNLTSSFYLLHDSIEVYSNSYGLISDTLFYNDSIIQNEIKRRYEVKKWEKSCYKFGNFETFYSHYLLEQIKHSSWDEQVYDLATGTFQVVHYSDCSGYRTGIYYPVEQAYLETEYDSLNRKKMDFVYTFDNEYTRDVERYYKYNEFNSIISNEGVLRGFDEVDYDTSHRYFERFINYKYDDENRLVNKKTTNYQDSVLSVLSIEYNFKGDTISKKQTYGEGYNRDFKYYFSGYPKQISTYYKLVDIQGNSFSKSINWKLKYNKTHQLIQVEESLIKLEEPEIKHVYSIIYN